MQKLLMDSYFDEFNLMYSHNIALHEIDRSGKEFYINTTETFDILYNQFDYVINSYENYFTTDFFNQLVKHQNDPKSSELINTFYNTIAPRVQKYCIANGIGLYIHDFVDHPYKKTFSLISMLMQEGELKYISPKKSDYDRLKEQIVKDAAGRKVVCITGRNIKAKDYGKNDLLKRWIEEALARNAFVINVTTPAPGINYYDLTCYREVRREVFTYSEMVSIFLNSNIVIALGSSGGISNHLCTRANIAAVLNNVHWINNPDYGHEHRSIIQARKMNRDLHTYAVLNDYSVLDELMYLRVPEVNEFFDEKKIIWI